MATTTRFVSGPNQDNTLRTVAQDYQSPAYAASLSITTTQDRTYYEPGALTGALALSVGVGGVGVAPFVGDKLEVYLKSTPGATVTFGAGFAVSSSTLVIAATKHGAIEFRFNGAVWVESNRTVTA